MEKTCESCGSLFPKPYHTSRKSWKTVRFCSYPCKHKWMRTFRWGKGTIVYGYRILSNGRHSDIPEHRKVMQEHIGRKLDRYEYVHHINGNRLDNRIENLKIMSPRDHSSMHFPKGSRFGKNK